MNSKKDLFREGIEEMRRKNKFVTGDVPRFPFGFSSRPFARFADKGL